MQNNSETITPVDQAELLRELITKREFGEALGIIATMPDEEPWSSLRKVAGDYLFACMNNDSAGTSFSNALEVAHRLYFEESQLALSIAESSLTN